MSTLIQYRDIKWPNYMNYWWTYCEVSISFSRSRQRPLHMTIYFTFCILINLIQTPSSSPSHLPTLENLWTIQEKRTTTLNIPSMIATCSLAIVWIMTSWSPRLALCFGYITSVSASDVEARRAFRRAKFFWNLLYYRSRESCRDV